MRRGSVSEQLVLWDIDGTLLNADGVGRDLYDVVFVQLFGRSIDAFAPMAGRTDRAIILETLTMAGVDEPRRYVDPFIAGLTAHAPSVREMVAIRGRALPGASEVLRGLQGRAHQSVLPGNIRAAGGPGKAPAAFAGGATVVIGDPPLDIEAALAAGARAVGVATGGYTASELTAAGADAVLPDLTDTDAVLQALLTLSVTPTSRTWLAVLGRRLRLPSWLAFLGCFPGLPF